MLGRVAVRSTRGYTLRASFPAVILPLQSRLYTKNNNPRQPFEYKPPSTGLSPQHEPSILAASPLGTPKPGGNVGQVPIDAAQLEEKFRNIDEQIKDLRATSSASSSSHDPSTLQDHSAVSTSSGSNVAHHSVSQSTTHPTAAQADHAQSLSSKPLPDLTQGIPSTLDAELDPQSGKSDPTSLNITEDPTASGGKGGGDFPKTAYISSLERKRARIARWIYGIVLVNLIGSALWFGRNWESEEEERKYPSAPSGWGLVLFYNRVKARWRGTLDYYNEPAFPKLLPDPDPAWERPYTLILSLEDLLVHSEWSRDHGWRMAKRPGVDYFLRYLSQYYELVIWTSAQSMIAQPIIQKLDPYRVVMWPLFREATRYQQGEYIKVIFPANIM